MFKAIQITQLRRNINVFKCGYNIKLIRYGNIEFLFCLFMQQRVKKSN